VPLGDLAVAALFGPEPRFSIALAVAGEEIADAGYRRQPVAWDVNAGRAVTVAVFGPFRAQVTIDAAWIALGDEVHETIPIAGGPVTLAPTMILEHTVEVVFA
jgi:hypothetical protein